MTAGRRGFNADTRDQKRRRLAAIVPSDFRCVSCFVAWRRQEEAKRVRRNTFFARHFTFLRARVLSIANPSSIHTYVQLYMSACTRMQQQQTNQQANGNGSLASPRKKQRMSMLSGGISKVTVVLGAQWGDEGKGKVVDMLAMDADVVCRCQVLYLVFFGIFEFLVSRFLFPLFFPSFCIFFFEYCQLRLWKRHVSRLFSTSNSLLFIQNTVFF